MDTLVMAESMYDSDGPGDIWCDAYSKLQAQLDEDMDWTNEIWCAEVKEQPAVRR
jgi:hypothetical protein